VLCNIIISIVRNFLFQEQKSEKTWIHVWFHCLHTILQVSKIPTWLETFSSSNIIWFLTWLHMMSRTYRTCKLELLQEILLTWLVTSSMLQRVCITTRNQKIKTAQNMSKLQWMVTNLIKIKLLVAFQKEE